jgi:hypothetical protein
MQETKLTIRVPRDLLDSAKRYASKNNTTLTNLIETYLQHLPDVDELENAPIVRALIGILPAEASIDDHRKHLDEKYGG